MNLEDVIDVEYGLQQDEWSLTKPTFGEDGQIEVIGWSGRDRTNKLYIVKCHECSEDRELFGDGVFKSLKYNLNIGQIPCGCAKKLRWSLDQWKIKAQRKAKELGYEFVDFAGEWRGAYTKIKLTCPKHGEWHTNTLNMLINCEQGCPQCRTDIIRERILKPDEEMIASFFASGAFHPDTKFWRSERLDSRGHKPYWNVYCPECNNTNESFVSSLQNGSRPCLCSNSRQQQAYINFIKDGDNPIALKFGIANVATRRINEQNRASIYNIHNYLIYEFPTKQECLKAELECKRELQCSILSREEMPDGWTETTYLSNLDKIIEIYKKHNGVIYES